ncbi:hypothetical protein Rhal01_02937 [Rubritalea halochordaticola]|uniref:ABC transporter permease n=1 Tax=Rubritalea halochordaticola TaxID=714537 RepID=A0ABP9V263_9BACT
MDFVGGNANFAALTTFRRLIIQKNFSLLLALRYLNPLRTHVSVITLISLLGVAVGVMVLIVVNGVMAGFEGVVKERVLGQSPHVVVQRVQPWQAFDANGNPLSAETQWRDLEQKLKEVKGVTNAYPLVEDFVIVDMNGQVVPQKMQGVDTQDKGTMEALKKLEIPGRGTTQMGMGVISDLSIDEVEAALDKDSVNDLSMEEINEAPIAEAETTDVCIVSSLFADNFQLEPGMILEIISNRNIKQLKPMLDRQNQPSIYDQHQMDFERLITDLNDFWKTDGEKESANYERVKRAQDFIVYLKGLNARQGELDLVDAIYQLTRTSDYDDTTNFYEKGRLTKLLSTIDELKQVDLKKLDEEEDMQFTELALPKKVKIVGVFRADRFAQGTPSLLVPLHLAQELAGAGDSGGIGGVAVKVEDPYTVNQILKDEIIPMLTANGLIVDWKPVTWMEQFEQQFDLIKQQKLMMVIALFFIVLVAVFSIGAVMFTVTVQKKREIGVMKALGATPAQITQVFTLQGVIVGILGAFGGVGLAILVLKNLDVIQSFVAKLGFDPFPASFYGMETLPHKVDTLEMVLVSVGAFLMCTLAAWIPAFMASRVDAARSLRNM